LVLAAHTSVLRGQGTGFGAELVERENEVAAQRHGTLWQPAVIGLKLKLRDKVRTGVRSRALLAITDRTVMRLDERTVAEIGGSSIKLGEGGIYFFSRERSPEVEIITPAATGFLHGTQLVARVTPTGRAIFSVFEGEVELVNAHGRLTLRSREQGEAQIGQAPRRTAVIVTTNLLQWALYYPAVIDPRDLGLSAAEERSVSDSLAAYRVGDLLGALEKYPTSYRPHSTAARLYRAGVVLAVGRVDAAQRELAGLRADVPGRLALEEMIAAVNRSERDTSNSPSIASEWLARSYYLQSRDQSSQRLESALAAARRATALAPEWGFASVRVAELEFSLGRTQHALRELGRIPAFSARNAQAHALRGFLLAAENRIEAARAEFQTAIDLDGALGNAWLGRGLCSIRQGRDAEGRLDLQIAAAMEPNRSLLHSYLGKAFSQIGDNASARKDLARAQELDPNDPTPLLYSAIQLQQENRYNESIDSLERSLALNENRRVYRSHFLLDQDRAVRGANLAAIYRSNGMTEQSIHEATRAVESNYASASAHLFLASSFDALRDPTRVLLRHEAAWSNELLLAHLLSPVGGGSLSQFVSQHEYSKLFEEDGLGLSSLTDYRGDGQLLQQVSQFGTAGNLSYALDGEYFRRDGINKNDQLARGAVNATVKLQVGPRDTALLLANFGWLESGLLFQSYDPSAAETIIIPAFDQVGNVISQRVPNRAALTYSLEEKETPGAALLGWNHEWSPGNHTLLLLGKLSSDQAVTAQETRATIYQRDATGLIPATLDVSATAPAPPSAFRSYSGRGPIVSLFKDFLDLEYDAGFEAWTGELQQIVTMDWNTLVVGGRWQRGQFDTRVRHTNLGSSEAEQFFDRGAALQDESVDGERRNVYLYNFLRPTRWLTLTGGVTYDWLRYPDNFRSPPINGRERSAEQFSPKAGITLEPWRGAVMRGIWARSLSGATFDESVRLEPAQIAGFPQAYRNVISESLIGEVAGSAFTIRGVALEQKLPTRTWLGADFSVIEQDVDRTVGAFDLVSSDDNALAIQPSSITEHDRYREEIFTATAHQLLGERWSLGARYRVTNSELSQRRPSVDAERAGLEARGALDEALADARRRTEATLHELSVFGIYNHPSGFFARAEANWFQQNSDHFVTSSVPSEMDGGTALPELRTTNQGLSGDDFWQFNVFGGYRFLRNQCSVTVGALNLTNTDYRLNPLNPYFDLPRERTWIVRCKLAF